LTLRAGFLSFYSEICLYKLSVKLGRKGFQMDQMLTLAYIEKFGGVENSYCSTFQVAMSLFIFESVEEEQTELELVLITACSLFLPLLNQTFFFRSSFNTGAKSYLYFPHSLAIKLTASPLISKSPPFRARGWSFESGGLY